MELKGLLLVLFRFLIINGNLYDNCNDIIRPDGFSVVSCDNSCMECNIICDNVSQCQNMRVYSGALNTTIICNALNACKGMVLYAGDVQIDGEVTHSYYRDKYQLINVDCTGDGGCLNSNMYVHGNFIESIIDANGIDSNNNFQNSMLDVKISPNNVINLICGNVPENCGTTTYNCHSGSCHCNGEYRGNSDGCSGLKNGVSVWTQTPTSNPTKLTTNPTSNPTLTSNSPTKYTSNPSNSPTNNPTNTPEIMTDCSTIIRPSEGAIVICSNKCQYCIVDCGYNVNQCHRTNIYSGANNTIISCTADNSCKWMNLFVGFTGKYPLTYSAYDFYSNSYDSVLIECLGSLSCAKSIIHVRGNFINSGLLNANSDSEDQFKHSILIVNMLNRGTFNLDCGLFDNTCYDNTEYFCHGGTCMCNNRAKTGTQGCISIDNGDKVSSITLNPTPQPTLEPTLEPTTSLPTIMPTVEPTIKTTQAIKTTPPSVYTFNQTSNESISTHGPTTDIVILSTNAPLLPTNNPTKIITHIDIVEIISKKRKSKSWIVLIIAGFVLICAIVIVIFHRIDKSNIKRKLTSNNSHNNNDFYNKDSIDNISNANKLPVSYLKSINKSISDDSSEPQKINIEHIPSNSNDNLSELKEESSTDDDDDEDSVTL